MKIFFHDNLDLTVPVTAELTTLNLEKSIEKTRQALDIAYSGFNNVVENDLIDSYIYEIAALQKRYEHLVNLAAKANTEKVTLHSKPSIRAIVSHVFS